MNLVIQQRKANIFEVDLLNAIEWDIWLGTEIWTLLVELNKHQVSDSMVKFLFDFEAYFDQVCQDIDMKRTNSARLQQTKEDMVVAWDLSDAYEKKNRQAWN